MRTFASLLIALALIVGASSMVKSANPIATGHALLAEVINPPHPTPSPCPPPPTTLS